MIVGDLAIMNEQELIETFTLAKLIDNNVEPIFKVKPIKHMLFREVVDIKGMNAQGVSDYEILLRVAEYSGLELSEKKIYKMPLVRYLRTINLINEYLEEVYNLEQSASTETDPYLVMAGIDKLNAHGDYLICDALAHGKLYRWGEIQETIYELTIIKRRIDRDNGEISNKYTELKSKRK